MFVGFVGVGVGAEVFLMKEDIDYFFIRGYVFFFLDGLFVFVFGFEFFGERSSRI